MAEVHVIGQVLNASHFPKQSLFCKWNIQFGNNWQIISGHKEGQTQVDSCEYHQDICYWYYPIDIHLATKGIQGWPKIHVQVFHLDWVGRVHFFGYGFLNVPTSPGVYDLPCYTWRPVGSLKDRLTQYFLGGGPLLKQPDLIYTGNDRYKLNTEPMGIVQFQLNIVLRNFEKFGVEYQ